MHIPGLYSIADLTEMRVPFENNSPFIIFFIFRCSDEFKQECQIVRKKECEPVTNTVCTEVESAPICKQVEKVITITSTITIIVAK